MYRHIWVWVMFAVACGGDPTLPDPEPRPTGTEADPSAADPGAADPGAAGPGVAATEPPTEEPNVPQDQTPTTLTVGPPSAADARALGAASVAFGADVYRTLSGTEAGSFGVSPASLLIALGMTAEGARGETQSQMNAAMRTQALGTGLTRTLGGQLAAWREVQGVELSVGNRLYMERSYGSFEPAFFDTTRDVFGAPIEQVDFVGAAEAARARINAWVAAQTHDRIDEILPLGSLDSLTRLVLVNALYFRGDWQVQFAESRTTDDFFRPEAGERVPARMMRRRGPARFGQTDDALVLELPYAGESTSMLLVLPRGETTLTSLTAELDADRLASWAAAPRHVAEVDIQVPRFRVAPPAPTPMNTVLQGLGMRLAFDRIAADFTGIANPSDEEERLHIASVFHRVFVEVDEAGTEAAAATAVVMSARGGRPGAAPAVPVFRADRPFLFAIRDTRSGTLLFLGRVSRP